MLSCVEVTLGCLAATGFYLLLADHAWDLLDAYNYGYTLQEISFPFAASDYQGTASGYLEAFPVARCPVLAPLVVTVAGEGD